MTQVFGRPAYPAGGAVIDRCPLYLRLFDMLAGDIGSRIHDEAQCPGSCHMFVGGYRHEVNAYRDRQAPGKIGKKYVASPENPHHHQFIDCRVIPENLTANPPYLQGAANPVTATIASAI